MLPILSENLCVDQMVRTVKAHLVHLDHLVHLEEMDTTLDQLKWASTLQNIYRVGQNLYLDIFSTKGPV